MLEQTIYQLDELSDFVAKCKAADRFSGIERDIILSKLRDLYEQVMSETPSEDKIYHSPVLTDKDATVPDESMRGEWSDDKPESADKYDNIEPDAEDLTEDELSEGGDDSLPVVPDAEVDADEEEDIEDEEEVDEKPQSYVLFDQEITADERELMLTELFSGDTLLLDETATILNRFKDLDEALIYIYETYDWTPDSKAASRLIELLSNKLG